jgi:hypothetical protein
MPVRVRTARMGVNPIDSRETVKFGWLLSHLFARLLATSFRKRSRAWAYRHSGGPAGRRPATDPAANPHDRIYYYIFTFIYFKSSLGG